MYKTMLIRTGDFDGSLRKYVPSHLQSRLNKLNSFSEFEDVELDLRLQELYDRLQIKNLRARKIEKREALGSRRGAQKPFYKTLWSSDSLRRGAVAYVMPTPRELSDVVTQ